jgi:hypothetical protein
MSVLRHKADIQNASLGLLMTQSEPAVVHKNAGELSLGFTY